MKKFKVKASYVTTCYAEIEAESVEDAFNKALDMDGGLFEASIDNDDWHIDDVVEVEE